MSQKKKKSLLSRINAWLHLWLGISSGLVVFVVSITGTIFVFNDEITDFISRDALHVQEVGAVKLTPEQVLQSFHKAHPTKKPFYFVTYKDPTRSIRIGAADKETKAMTFTYVNPYTGKMLMTTAAYGFFYTVAHLHSQLLLHKTGKTIVGIATIIFFIQLLTGLVLWFPSKWTKGIRDARLKIKWNAKWRRVNYDLHNVVGFYSLIPALLITVTGLVEAYKPIKNVADKIWGGNTAAEQEIKKRTPTYQPEGQLTAYSPIVDRMFAMDEGINAVRISIPFKDSVTTLFCTAGSYVGIKSVKDIQFTMVDKYTGKELPLPRDVMQHEIIEFYNLELHMGQWMGMPVKILTFLAGLVCTSLPVTGFLIWWGRRNKKSTKEKKQTVKKGMLAAEAV